MHVHVSALNFLIFLAYLILGLALINAVATWKGDTPVGQAAGVLQLG